jgi:hypothetical protein
MMLSKIFTVLFLGLAAASCGAHAHVGPVHAGGGVNS